MENFGLLPVRLHRPSDNLGEVTQDLISRKGVLDRLVPDGWAPLLIDASRIAQGSDELTIDEILKIHADMWGYYLDLAGVNRGSKRAAALNTLVLDRSMAYGHMVNEKSSELFWKLVLHENNKPTFEDKGYDSMAFTGGVHQQGLDVTNCILPESKLLTQAIKVSTIAFLENQLVTKDLPRPEMAAIRKSILQIQDELGGGVKVGSDWITHDSSTKFGPSNGFTTEKYDWGDEKWKEQVLVRIFSQDETKYVDVSYAQFEKNDDIFNGDYDWKKIEGLDDDQNWPLFAVSITNIFATESSKIYKYRATRGKNMIHVNLVVNDDGRVVEFFAGHTRMDGLGVKEIVDVFDKSITSKRTGEAKAKLPNFLIYPNLDRLSNTSAVDRLMLSDLILFSDLDPTFLRVLSYLNKCYVDKHDSVIKESGLAPAIVNPRINIAQILTLAEGEAATFAVFPLNKTDRLSLAIAATLPESILTQMRKIYAGEVQEITLPRFNQLDVDRLIKAIDLTRLGQTLSRLGLPIMGYIQQLVESKEKSTIVVTRLIRKELDLMMNPTKMNSTIGRGGASFFVSAQNHRRDSLAVSEGVINEKLSWRVNLNNRLFDKLDLTHPVDDTLLLKLFGNNPLNVSVDEIKRVYGEWTKMREENRKKTNSHVLIKFMKTLNEDDLQLFRYCIVSKIYERMERTKSIAMGLVLRATEAST